MDLTPLAFSLLFAVLCAAYVCSCALNLVEWCLETGGVHTTLFT